MKNLAVAYASRSNYEGESLAPVWMVSFVRCHLLHNSFTFIIDRHPLTWLMGACHLGSDFIREYDLTMVHRPGIINCDVDGLSQKSCTSQVNKTGWHPVNVNMNMNVNVNNQQLTPLGVTSVTESLPQAQRCRIDMHLFSWGCWCWRATWRMSQIKKWIGHFWTLKWGRLMVSLDIHDDLMMLEYLCTGVMMGFWITRSKIEFYNKTFYVEW